MPKMKAPDARLPALPAEVIADLLALTPRRVRQLATEPGRPPPDGGRWAPTASW